MREKKIDFTDSINECRKGNIDAFEFVYNQSISIFKSEVLKYMKNEIDTDDVLQEVYTYIYTHLDDLKDTKSFIGWGLKICRTRALNALDKSKIESITDYHPPISDEDEPGIDSLNVASTGMFNDPQIQMDGNATKELLASILNELPDIQRACVLLRIEGYSTKEVAQELQIPEGTVKSNVNYGKKKVKEKVLELEKQGTKLYGLAPIPFFLWLLRMYDATYVPTKPQGIDAARYQSIANQLAEKARSGNSNTSTNINDSFDQNIESVSEVGKVATGMTSAKAIAVKVIVSILAIVIVGTGICYVVFKGANKDPVIKNEETNDTDEEKEKPQNTNETVDISKEIPYEYVGNKFWVDADKFDLPSGYVSGYQADLDGDGTDEIMAITLEPTSDTEYSYSARIFEKEADGYKESAVASIKNQLRTDKIVYSNFCMVDNRIVYYTPEYAMEATGENYTIYEYNEQDNCLETCNDFNNQSWNTMMRKAIFLSSVQTSFLDIKEVPMIGKSNSTSNTSYLMNCIDYTDMSELEENNFTLKYPKYFDEFLKIENMSGQVPEGELGSGENGVSYYFNAKYITEFSDDIENQSAADRVFDVAESFDDDIISGFFPPISNSGGQYIGFPESQILWKGENDTITLMTSYDPGNIEPALHQNNPDGYSNLDLYNIYYSTLSNSSMFCYLLQYNGSNEGTLCPEG